MTKWDFNLLREAEKLFAYLEVSAVVIGGLKPCINVYKYFDIEFSDFPGG